MKIKIKNANWKVDFVNEVDEFDDLGLTKKLEKQILIRNNQTQTETMDTIAHELVHAYLHECGHFLSREEEEKVATFVGRVFVEMSANFDKILKGRK